MMAELNASNGPASNCSDDDRWSLETSSTDSSSERESSNECDMYSTDATGSSEYDDSSTNECSGIGSTVTSEYDDSSGLDASSSESDHSSEFDGSSIESEDSSTELDSDSKISTGPGSDIDEAQLQLLYPGADITVFDRHLLVFQYTIRHSPTKQAFSELLNLVSARLPRSAKLSPSVFKLKKYFTELLPHVESITHKYCCTCHCLVQSTSAALVCENGCSPAKFNEFLEVPVAPQLKHKLEGICTTL